jgi:hypothetical protein
LHNRGAVLGMIDDVAGFHGPLATQAFRSGAHAWIVARNPNSCFEVPLRSIITPPGWIVVGRGGGHARSLSRGTARRLRTRSSRLLVYREPVRRGEVTTRFTHPFAGVEAERCFRGISWRRTSRSRAAA